MTVPFDFNKTYVADGWGAGIAWRATEFAKEVVQVEYINSDGDGDVYEELWYEAEEIVDETRIVCHMVGDDSKFTFDISELTEIDEDDYCHSCGQIGCTHDGR